MSQMIAPYNEVQVLDLTFVGPHGVFERERVEGRLFKVDVCVETGPMPGFETDDIEDTLDYSKIAEIVMDVGKGPSRKLIEYMAEDIARRVLEIRFAQVVQVHIRKQTTGVAGHPTWVGVKIRRAREDAGQ